MKEMKTETQTLGESKRRKFKSWWRKNDGTKSKSSGLLDKNEEEENTSSTIKAED